MPQGILTRDEIATRLARDGAAWMTVPGTGPCLFETPVARVTARILPDVVPALAALDRAREQGRTAVGFLSYEAAPAFDPAFRVRTCDDGFPLLSFAIYDRPPIPVGWPAPERAAQAIRLEPGLGADDYRTAFADVRRHIVAGDIYQANLTFRCRGRGIDDPGRSFLDLLADHPVPYAAFLNLDGIRILSLSPELFLESDGVRLVGSPMKGTAARLPDAAADRGLARSLAHDEKNRAENLMIVDMVRNDFGRVCRPGSIRVDPLLHVDTYATVHQMISTVHGELEGCPSLVEVLCATFPPASITGAPKISAMRVLARDESSPRHVYTGAIGCLLPGGVFRLNVAIRTLVCQDGRFELGVGGGVTSGSTAAGEWAEALLKSRFAVRPPFPPFEVFETMRADARGVRRLREHLRRAEASQRYFGRPFNRAAVRAALVALVPALAADPALRAGACVKMILAADGAVRTRVTPPRLPDWRRTPLAVLVSADRTRSDDVFLSHKTTCRAFYDERLRAARAAGFHEVLFLNERGELTEGSISNIFIRRDGHWLTPARACGLLPGIWRASAIRRLHAAEARLGLADLLAATEVRIGNSVRGTGRVILIAEASTGGPDSGPRSAVLAN